MKIGKNMKSILEFVNKYHGLISYKTNHKPTRDAVRRLEKLGLIAVNEFNQIQKI